MGRGAICLAAVALVGLAAAPATAGPAPSGGICTMGMVYDYEAALGGMPPLRTLPADNDLPFGPPGLFLDSRYPPRDIRLPGDEMLGFRFTAKPREVKPSYPLLDWRVTARLTRVNRRGVVREVLAEVPRRVSRMRRSIPFPLELEGEPGFYRLEIVFREGGRRIGRFGQYVRVLSPSVDVRLGLNGTTFRPGDTVIPRLENYGAANLGFGLLGAGFQIEKSGAWAPAWGSGPAPAIGLGAGPGESAECWSRKLPADAQPGRYRFNLQVDHVLEERGPAAGEQTYSAEFTVLP
jgi:hypothetical protein